MGSLSKTNQNVQEVLFQEVVQEVVQVDQVDQGFDQVVAPLDALSVVRQAPDDEGVPGELRGHPQGGYLRSPAPQAHDGRLRRLPPAAVWRLRQRRWLRLDGDSPGQLRLPVRLLCPGPHALLCPHALRHLRRPQLRHLRHPLLRWSTLRKLYLCARKIQRSEIFSRVRERVG